MVLNESDSSVSESNLKNRLVIKTGEYFYILNNEDIIYIQSSGNYLEIYTPHKKYFCRGTLKSMLVKLDTSIFFQIHKSIIVNIDYVIKIGANGQGDFEVTLNNGSKLKMSRNYKQILERD